MITIYRTKHCPYCKMVAQYLDIKKVPYEFVSVDDDVAMRTKLFEITGRMQVPVTTNGKDYVVGYNISRLAALL